MSRQVTRMAAAVMVATGAIALLGGCAFRDPNAPTTRDVEIARQMDAPDGVISSMEGGEWLYSSDRDAVRYVEIAIDHMSATHGVECVPDGTPSLPWVMQREVQVDLRVPSRHGDPDCDEVTVCVDAAGECTDDWVGRTRASGYVDLCAATVAQALPDVPSSSYTIECQADYEGMSDGQTWMGDTTLYVSRSVIPDEAALQSLKDTLHAVGDDRGIRGGWRIRVPAEEPHDGVMTLEFGKEAARGGINTEGLLFRESWYTSSSGRHSDDGAWPTKAD